MDNFLVLVELVGTVAFAVSGAATAIRKEMDVFGVCILGVVTAVGGGVLRDLMIGFTPPQCFRDPLYLMVAGFAALAFFVLHRPLQRRRAVFDWVLFAMDTVGLAVFTVVGIQTAERVSGQFGAVLLVCVGMLTGTGGGILRDLLAGNTPYVFVKHVYATASMAGAVLYLLLCPLGYYPSTIAAMALIVVIRCLSARYRWNLPRSGE